MTEISTSKERPILFNGEMVRAILEGRKTQTRRPVTPPNGICHECFMAATPHNGSECAMKPGPYLRVAFCEHNQATGWRMEAPVSIGDRLWVRETWATPHAFDHLKPRHIPCDTRVHHMASWEGPCGLIKRPSIHMPRWASRITLEITDVRVQRLQDITGADLRVEGVKDALCHTVSGVPVSFAELWDSTYPKLPWSENPWVWAYTFRRLT